MTQAAEQPLAPPVWRVLASSIWPSLRRSVLAVCTLFGFPLFVLAVLSALKFFGSAGLVSFSPEMKEAITLQQEVIDNVITWLAANGLQIPPWLIDAGTIYLSIGATAARAEKDSLLAVEMGFREGIDALFDCFRRFRADYAFLSVPPMLRGSSIRLLWPILFLHRLSTPYVVDGLGPDGDEITTSVPRGEMADFIQQVSEAGLWDAQTVYDQRQIVLWQFALGAAAAYFSNWVSSLI